MQNEQLNVLGKRKYIRNEMLLKRNMLNREFIKVKSSKIYNRIINDKIRYIDKTVFCYISFNNEVITDDLMNFIIEHKGNLAVPKITDYDNKIMHAVRINDISEITIKNKYNIREPKMIKNNIVNPKDIDEVILPGLAFDITGNRLGYGHGYYDRFLKKVSAGCIKTALAYDFQIVEKIPKFKRDIKTDRIITENRMINIMK